MRVEPSAAPGVRPRALRPVRARHRRHRRITGQTFLVWGGLVSALRPWDLGPVLGADERWEPGDLLTALTETYPAGLRPEGSQPALTRFRGGRPRGG
jgi:hypothetical protein